MFLSAFACSCAILPGFVHFLFKLYVLFFKVQSFVNAILLTSSNSATIFEIIDI